MKSSILMVVCKILWGKIIVPPFLANSAPETLKVGTIYFALPFLVCINPVSFLRSPPPPSLEWTIHFRPCSNAPLMSQTPAVPRFASDTRFNKFPHPPSLTRFGIAECNLTPFLSNQEELLVRKKGFSHYYIQFPNNPSTPRRRPSKQKKALEFANLAN